jgi:hypothetical protein
MLYAVVHSGVLGICDLLMHIVMQYFRYLLKDGKSIIYVYCIQLTGKL